MLKYKLYAYFYISRTNIHYQNYGIMEDQLCFSEMINNDLKILKNINFKPKFLKILKEMFLKF
jgi:hypothetical protein